MKQLFPVLAFFLLSLVATNAASAQTTVSNIDQLTGWDQCGSCAGPGGKGTNTPRSMTQHISSPSMDGSAIKFSVGKSTPYAAALWWKQLGAHPTATHFVYDLYYYMTTPSVAQALEFDANQSLNGKKYIFGTECSLGRKEWDVYDASLHWVHTGVGCTPPSAYKWHHLTWEFQRVSGKVKYIAVTVDGKKSYLNRLYNPKTTTAKELNVAFQMDENGSGTGYSVWVDKISFKYW